MVKTPNKQLQRERELRGWSQEKVAEELGTTEKRVSRWECGECTPGPSFRQKLCDLYGKNAEELGIIERRDAPKVSIPNTISPLLPLSQKEIEGPYTSTPTREWILPLPPHPYFAHPYPLQENFTGRIRERQMLTKWLIRDKRSVLVLVALGGMGKSALTWFWLQQEVLRLPEASRPHGLMWWSFYEAEATFPAFLNQALIYASGGTLNPKLIGSIYEKTQMLLTLLQHRRLLLVLDGFERVLRAYAGPTSSSQENDVSEHAYANFRVCLDPHAGSFLRWVAAGPLLSKVVLTTRLFPHELDGLVGCQREELLALKPEDAVTFLHAQGVRGTRAEIQALCSSYGYHPLALRLLAGLIVHDPAHPGDVDVATEYNPLSELVQREHHILSLAYDALRPPLQQLLSQLAALRSKVAFEMIRVLSPFETEKELKEALRELMERGLLFFDHKQGCYDLHPVVRQYAYGRLVRKAEIHTRLVEYFWSMKEKELTDGLTEAPRKLRAFVIEPSSKKSSHMAPGEDIAPIVELYYHMIHAKQFERAFGVYYHHLAGPLYHQLGAYQTMIELLQVYFPSNEVSMPTLERNRQSWLLDALAHAYSATGYPRRAVDLLKESIYIDQECGDKESLATALWNLAVQQQVLGKLAESEQSLQESIAICHEIHDPFNEAKSHQYLALLRAYQGLFEASSRHLDTAFALLKELDARTPEGVGWAYRSLCLLLAGNIPSALVSAQRARKLADVGHYERDIIRAEWLLGLVLVHSASKEVERAREILQEAEQHLSEALQRCRRIDMVDYEADLLLACARLHHTKGEKHQARACATEALEIANRSDFRVLRADIHNLLARLELEQSNRKGAMRYARAAFHDATCDGSPYWYQSALEEAEYLLGRAKQLP